MKTASGADATAFLTSEEIIIVLKDSQIVNTEVPSIPSRFSNKEKF